VDWIEEDSEEPPGLVLGTTPAPGARVPKALLVVSVRVAREPLRAVPDVTGLDPLAAAVTLTQAGLRVNPLPQETTSDAVEVGRVVATNPPKDTMVPRDTEIVLILSSGPATVELPDLVGRPRAEAEAAITGLGCSVRITEQVVNPPPQKGIVLSQSPAGGTRLPCNPDLFVDLTVGV
jgi:serine/threonine-protein kinase